MKSIILYLLLLLSVSSASAKLVSLEGKVIDGQTNESLPGALITIPDLKISVVS